MKTETTRGPTTPTLRILLLATSLLAATNANVNANAANDDGPAVFPEHALVVDNRAGEPVVVWYQVWTRVPAGPAGALEYRWFPGEPGSDRAWSKLVPRDATLELRVPPDPAAAPTATGHPQPDTPVRGARFRLWAESESGIRWDLHRDRDLRPDALPPDDRPADSNAPLVHRLAVPDADPDLEPAHRTLRRHTERFVAFRNATDQPVALRVEYRGSFQGETRWRTVESLPLAPGETKWLRNAHRLAARASRVRFRADGSALRFAAGTPAEPLPVVEPGGYLSERMQTYTIELHNAPPNR